MKYWLNIVMAPVVALPFCFACGSSDEHPTAEAALRDVLGAYCPKLQDCAPDGFAAAFPGGVSACVQEGVDMLEDKTALSACTQAEIDDCVADTGDVACVDSSIEIPTSCSKC